MRRSVVLAGFACAVLAACGDKTPKGQVVATVHGDEITRTQLQEEIRQSGAQGNTPEARKQLEQAVLQSIVARKALADAARKEGIEKTPEFAMLRDRAVEGLLVQSYQERLVKSVPAISADEARAFMDANPDVFAQRKIFVVDQIRTPRPADPRLLERLRPLNTMEEVASLLRAENMPFQRGGDTIDAVGTDPNVVRQMVALPPAEVFVIPLPGGLLINEIKETRVQPFTGEQAVRYAQQTLATQRRGEVVNKQFASVVTGAKDKIAYAKGFEPPKPQKANTKAAAPQSKDAK